MSISNTDVASDLVRATSALLAAVTLTGTLAGIQLLHGRQRGSAVVASVFLGVVLVFRGALLAIPAVVGGVAALLRGRAGAGRGPAVTSGSSPIDQPRPGPPVLRS